eukprot:2690127-Amphidinium_carterae.1
MGVLPNHCGQRELGLQVGYIEISGDDVNGIHGRLEDWLSEHWGCSNAQVPEVVACDCAKTQ